MPILSVLFASAIFYCYVSAEPPTSEIPNIYLPVLGRIELRAQRYMDSIPGIIPPSKDVAKSTTPPDIITTPKGPAMRWLLGIVFSAK